MTTLNFSAPLQTVSIEAGYPPMGYVSLTGQQAADIAGHELERRLEPGQRRGFGSVKCRVVVVGSSQWTTSVFPQQGGSWFLPIKKAVRAAEGLAEGDRVSGALELL